MGSRTPRALRGRWGGLAVAVTAGALLSGCTPAAPPVAVAAATAAMPTSPWTNSAPQVRVYPDLPVGDSAAVGGLQVPQPPRPTHVGQVPAPLVAHGTAPSLTPPTAVCGGYGNSPRRISPGAEPGAGSATLSWMADGRPGVTGYQVTAVPQQLVGGAQPAPAQQRVAQPDGCVPVSVTMAGLASGVPYVFWLEEQVVDSRTQAVRLVQVGTSGAVVIR